MWCVVCIWLTRWLHSGYNHQHRRYRLCVCCLCCCSAIVTGDKALLFEPASNNTRKLLDALVPRLQVGWRGLTSCGGCGCGGCRRAALS